jgi:hypothetical protein
MYRFINVDKLSREGTKSVGNWRLARGSREYIYNAVKNAKEGEGDSQKKTSSCPFVSFAAKTRIDNNWTIRYHII